MVASDESDPRNWFGVDVAWLIKKISACSYTPCDLLERANRLTGVASLSASRYNYSVSSKYWSTVCRVASVSRRVEDNDHTLFVNCHDLYYFENTISRVFR